ncbi:protein FAR-RED IMPAIRED RESPONSE 1-like [Chenopodium quinoa]|uniref:protein FAR-RED IMPAIRED RESPONSE 1-like n=1 Tax=Chenopodium quinoa TaxID=63459 RepID=UPI000B780A53|nr:protein FAR-RED IMPAIRED RESPONSE 1-like [Chenopodium quinoa]
MFHKCLSGCDSKLEFGDVWNKMVLKHGLEKKEWFDRLFGLREKWCTALSKDIFSAGILSSQRVEVTNRAISFKANRTTKLLEFFHIFEATVRRWRSTEKSDNFRCTTEKPKTTTKILKHAAEVYTMNLYKDFKLEFDTNLGAYAKEKPTSMQYVKFFDVSLDEDYMHTYQVIYHCQDNEFMCSCMCFTETGLLCFHILKIMQMYSIHAILERYILKRWTKLTKSMIWDENESELIPNKYYIIPDEYCPFSETNIVKSDKTI